MKKLFLSLVAAIVAATATFAQSSLVATLSHNSTITTFYGASALKDAYDKAENGDVITLSSGTFNAVGIVKSLTIRGAGMGVDNKTQADPTIIRGNFTIGQTYIESVTIEGVYSNDAIFIRSVSNATFLKSRFNEIKRYSDSEGGENLTFIHCRIAGLLSIAKNTSVTCVNSIVKYPENMAYGTSNVEFNNCVAYRGKFPNDLFRATFKNSIFLLTTAVEMDKSNLFNNTLGVYTDGDADIFANATNKSNTQVKGFSEVFKTFTDDFSDDETFELTDAAATNYLGNDKTQVGIYGGNMPYDGTPTNPQIVKCDVAAKTTADGKLSIDIEVESAQ